MRLFLTTVKEILVTYTVDFLLKQESDYCIAVSSVTITLYCYFNSSDPQYIVLICVQQRRVICLLLNIIFVLLLCVHCVKYAFRQNNQGT